MDNGSDNEDPANKRLKALNLQKFEPLGTECPSLELSGRQSVIVVVLTSQPLPGGSPSQPGGGPPNFLCPVVTSRE